MSYFKDASNNLYWLDDDSQVNLLPPGVVQITQEEAEAIRNPPPTDEQLAAQARLERDGYLAQCDTITTIYVDQRAMSSAGISVVEKYTADQYREILVIKQELRDIPEQSGFPRNIVWPTRPAWV